MGFINNMHRGQKDVDKLLRQDFENRAKGFDKEYKELVHKYKCAHKSILQFVAEGAEGIVPRIVVMDATKLLEMEKVAKENKEKEKNEQK